MHREVCKNVCPYVLSMTSRSVSSFWSSARCRCLDWICVLVSLSTLPFPVAPPPLGGVHRAQLVHGGGGGRRYGRHRGTRHQQPLREGFTPVRRRRHRRPLRERRRHRRDGRASAPHWYREFRLGELSLEGHLSLLGGTTPGRHHFSRTNRTVPRSVSRFSEPDPGSRRS